MPQKMLLKQETLQTALGDLWVFNDTAGRLRAVEWAEHESRLQRLFRRLYPGMQLSISAADAASAAAMALADYFQGRIAAIEGLRVAEFGTPFQTEVWSALRRVARGTTTTYGALAQHLGRPLACRAVGLANGSNPVCVVVPCHRVLGARAALTGYSGGLERKRWLIDHERRHVADER